MSTRKDKTMTPQQILDAAKAQYTTIQARTADELDVRDALYDYVYDQLDAAGFDAYELASDITSLASGVTHTISGQPITLPE